MTNIFIANLDWEITSEDLAATFSAFGEVHLAHVVFDAKTKQSKGFGYVEMLSAEEAIKAIQALNGFEVNGRKLDVKIASPKANRPKPEDKPKARPAFGNKPAYGKKPAYGNKPGFGGEKRFSNNNGPRPAGSGGGYNSGGGNGGYRPNPHPNGPRPERTSDGSSSSSSSSSADRSTDRTPRPRKRFDQ